MTTREFQFIAGDLALDFVNTVGNRLGAADEYFRTAADVTRWARLAGLLGATQSLRLTDPQLRAITTTRETLYRVFRAVSASARTSAAMVASVDALFARVAPNHRLVIRDGLVRWEWRVPATHPARVLGPVLASACALLVSGTFAMIHECDGEHCGWLFLDRSRAGRRRWCSMRDCGNRAKARRHYDAIRRA